MQQNTETRSRIIVAVEKKEVLHIFVCTRARVRACARARGRVHARECM